MLVYVHEENILTKKNAYTIYVRDYKLENIIDFCTI